MADAPVEATAHAGGHSFDARFEQWSKAGGVAAGEDRSEHGDVVVAVGVSVGDPLGAVGVEHPRAAPPVG